MPPEIVGSQAIPVLAAGSWREFLDLGRISDVDGPFDG
jgi:hypothetical protein